MNKHRQSLHAGVLSIGVTTLAFSTIEIAGKIIAGSISPLQLTFLRFLIGGLFLLPFALADIRRREIRLTAADFLFFTLTGALGIVIGMCLLQSAVLYTKAALAAAIFSSNPLFTAPLARLLLGERMEPRKWIALALSMAGITLIFNPFSANPDTKGMALALAAAVSFSLYTVVSKSRAQRYGGPVLNSFSFLSGTAILLLLLLLLRMPVIAGISKENIGYLLYLGIFATGVGYSCYFAAMKHISAIAASTVFFVKPALAAVLSALILKESFTALGAAGIALIVLSSFLMLCPGRAEK